MGHLYGDKCRNRGTRVVSVADLEEMKRLRQQGFSFGIIGQRYGISRTSAFNYITGKQKPYNG